MTGDKKFVACHLLERSNLVCFDRCDLVDHQVRGTVVQVLFDGIKFVLEKRHNDFGLRSEVKVSPLDRGMLSWPTGRLQRLPYFEDH
jgi:hypothetical protein